MDTILNVPYSEKDEAKALGARWNQKLKKWYVPDGVDIAKFSKWVQTESDSKGRLLLVAPIFIVKSHEQCWKCGKVTDVFCIASSSLVEEGEDYGCFVMFANLTKCDGQLRSTLSRVAPNYKPAYSKQSESTYFMNHCEHCGAKIGDFYMHCEPGASFCPEDEEQAREITLFEIAGLESEVRINGSPGVSMPSLIQTYAKSVML